ncbi:hypothetical protein LJE06_04025 [Bilophila wadsworthia]|uniref:hypothetical protein n=1 Tax=Bilophila wadsworthia TaxID=35833 RepID=UPI001D09FCF7|nr:hypothetical protein [Bilophila wadsworthia]MCB8570272.1 hypothetical protein [Bilophila wadsworthia]MCC2714291.1 hypothetical protein [Bilophila wadsworthia]
MGVDFLNAHERHWDDAEILYTFEKWANADHLYGISAECGVKSLMCAFSIQTAPLNERLCSRDKKHIDKLNSRYDAYRSGLYATQYQIDFSAFSNWDIGQRYVHESDITQENVQLHRVATVAIRETIKQARLNGVLS